MAETGYKDKAVSGAMWTFVETAATQIVSFGIGIVLARLLSPSDYGTVGMLGIFTAIAATFKDAGLSHALIQKKDCTDIDYDTMFVFNLVVSIFFYIALFIGAPYIADFYNMPILTDITRVSTIPLVLSAFTSAMGIRMTKDLRFKAMSVRSIVGIVLMGGIGIGLAYMGLGVWALVIQGLASTLYSMVTLWYLTRWVPHFRFSMASFRQLFGFGSKLLCSGLINTIYGNLYSMVIGKKFSAADLGLFSRGTGYAAIPVGIVSGVALRVAFPVLAKMQDDNARLLAGYRKLMRTPLYVLCPMLVGMAVVAEPLIEVMIGAKWLACVPILQITCLGGAFTPLTHINLNLLYVKGRTDLVLKLEVMKKPIGFLILFSSIPFGLLAMAAGKAFYEFVAFTFNCYYTKKILNYGFWEQLGALLPVFVYSAIMGVSIIPIMSLVETPGLKLLVGIPSGVAVYIICSAIGKDESFFEIKEIVMGWVRKVLRR